MTPQAVPPHRRPGQLTFVLRQDQPNKTHCATVVSQYKTWCACVVRRGRGCRRVGVGGEGDALRKKNKKKTQQQKYNKSPQRSPTDCGAIKKNMHNKMSLPLLFTSHPQVASFPTHPHSHTHTHTHPTHTTPHASRYGSHPRNEIIPLAHFVGAIAIYMPRQIKAAEATLQQILLIKLSNNGKAKEKNGKTNKNIFIYIHIYMCIYIYIQHRTPTNPPLSHL